MPTVSIYNTTRFTSLAAGDVIPVVDISDPAQSAHGSLDSITVANFFAAIPVPVVISIGTVTVSAPGLSMAQTWNNAAVTFHGAVINVTNTASAALSNIWEVQLASTPKVQVSKAGGVILSGLLTGRTDVGSAVSTLEIQSATDAIQSFYMTGAASTTAECALAFFANDAAAAKRKIGVLNGQWADTNTTTGYASVNLHVTYLSGATQFDEYTLVAWGKHGAALWPVDVSSASAPGDKIFAITSPAAKAIAIGPNGATTPVFSVDASTASAVAGLKVTGAATLGTVALGVTTDSGAANLTINAAATGTIAIGSVSTGTVTITPTLATGAALSVGAVIDTRFQLLVSGTLAAVNNPRAVSVRTTTTPNAGSLAIGLEVAATFIDAGSGTHAEISAAQLNALTRSGTGATITKASTLSITGAPSYGSDNWALDIQGGNVLLAGSGSALATNATSGFTYIPNCAGTPTGTPADLVTGATPMIYDTSANKVWFYAGSWRGVLVI